MTTEEDIRRLIGNSDNNNYLCPVCHEEVVNDFGKMSVCISKHHYHFNCFCKKYGCELQTAILKPKDNEKQLKLF